jgi:hypothetical protein
VQNACYLRAQSAKYFELAQLMSLAADKEMCRALGGEYLTRALQVEREAAEPPDSDPLMREPHACPRGAGH